MSTSASSTATASTATASVATDWQGGNPYLRMPQLPHQQHAPKAASGARKRANRPPTAPSACAWKVASHAIYVAWENTPSNSSAITRLAKLRREIDVLIRASY